LPARMLMPVSLALALLAGTTVQALCTEPGPTPAVRRRCRVLLLTIMLAALFLRGGSLLLLATGGLDIPLPVFFYAGVLVVTVPAAFWLLGPLPSPGARVVWAWVVLLLVDLWALAWPLVAVRPEEEISAPSASVRYLSDRNREVIEHHDRMRVLDRGLPSEPSCTPLGAALPMLGGVEIEPVLG